MNQEEKNAQDIDDLTVNMENLWDRVREIEKVIKEMEEWLKERRVD